MNSKKTIKIIGLVVSVIGFGLSLVSDWVSDKNLEMTIDEKVANEVAKRFTEQA